MVSLRGSTDINTAVKKATTPDETAPKRKYVRMSVVYTWDHHNGRDFWNAIKLQPIMNSEVQTFKALITIHKVIQEGHRSVLAEAQHHTNWLRSLSQHTQRDEYGRLIAEYIRFLLHKLEFHRTHQAFNGTFEYEEYISLRQVEDPNEGYGAIIDLLNLQDALDDYQRLLFSTLKGRYGNECRISSLVPMVAESYGIFRFLTSMLRAMRAAGADDEVLEPLRNRYNSQHRRLRNFYFDCSSLKFLTSLISIPQLDEFPPDLMILDDEAPPLPKRPIESQKTGASTVGTASMQPTPTGDWYKAQADEDALNQQRYYEEQIRLQQAQEAEARRQQELAAEHQRQFEYQQAQLAAQHQAAQQELLRQQAQQNAQGRVVELEQQILALRQQQEEAQMMLGQYDERVQALETEQAQYREYSDRQFESKDELIEELRGQIAQWTSKYESLAKLYSQLRQEHFDLINKHKVASAKAASAEESVHKREQMERDLRNKNLELADLIRERDRARYELDRTRGKHRDETDRLERDLSLLNDQLSKTQLSGSERAALIDTHTRELRLLEDKLAKAADNDEVQYLREAVAALESELASSTGGGDSSPVLLDEVLKSASELIKDGLLQYYSPIEASTQGTTVPQIQPIVDRCWDALDTFSDAFTDYIAAEGHANGKSIVAASMTLSSSIVDLLINAKGIVRMMRTPSAAQSVEDPTIRAATATSEYFETMLSSVLSELTVDDQIELVVINSADIQNALQQLLEAASTSRPKTSANDPDSAMARAMAAAEQASKRLAEMIARPSNGTFDRQVHEAILAAVAAIAAAITQLISAAAECQKDIVAKGRGTDSALTYYKKNHRWTQGLISAAHAVAESTDTLIETADGSLEGTSSPEEMIVASNEVAAATAQLVAAARVKADHASPRQQTLEEASKSVSTTCKELLAKVQAILAGRDGEVAKEADFSRMGDHEFKTKAMTLQVEVLRLERMLTSTRNQLFAVRREEYARYADDE